MEDLDSISKVVGLWVQSGVETQSGRVGHQKGHTESRGMTQGHIQKGEISEFHRTITIILEGGLHS